MIMPLIILFLPLLDFVVYDKLRQQLQQLPDKSNLLFNDITTNLLIFTKKL